MTNLQKLTSIPLEELQALFKQHGSKSAVLRVLGIHEGDGRARRVIQERLGEEAQRQAKFNYTKEEIEQAFRSAQCWSDVYRSLQISIGSASKSRVLTTAKAYGIEIPVFDISKTFQRGKTNFSFDFQSIFTANSSYPRGRLNQAVRRYNVLGECKCSKCGIGETWQGEPLIIQVDHRNGICNDNRPENLRWLCPNCHSQTSNFGSKNTTREDGSVAQLV